MQKIVSDLKQRSNSKKTNSLAIDEFILAFIYSDLRYVLYITVNDKYTTLLCIGKMTFRFK